MLVMSRKPGEQVRVPQCDLVFTILEIHGNKVRVGITAPPDVQVYRHEVWERIQHSQVLPETSLPGEPGGPEAEERKPA